MDNWDLIRQWQLVIPPSRPSATQLGRIRQVLRGIRRDGAVAVLGSTPEFRDLYWEAGFQDVFVFDRNRQFFDAMASHRVYRSPETLVHGDWIETLPRFVDRFDCILSDLTSGNVPYEERETFYRGIEGALAPHGRFIDKVLTHDKPLLQVESLVKKYDLLPMNLVHVNHFSSEMLFCSELLHLSADVDSTRFYTLLDESVHNERVRAFAKRAEAITPPGCRWWYGKPWSDLKPSYCQGLRLLAVNDEEVGSPYCGFAKHFDLQKGV